MRRRTEPMVILEEREIPAFLKSRMVSLGCANIAELAKAYGISRQLMHALINGERKPGPAILKKLGLRRAFAIGPLPENLKPKSKAKPPRKPTRKGR